MDGPAEGCFAVLSMFFISAFFASLIRRELESLGVGQRRHRGLRADRVGPRVAELVGQHVVVDPKAA